MKRLTLFLIFQLDSLLLVCGQSKEFNPNEAYEAICNNEIYNLNKISQYQQVFDLASKTPKEDCPSYINDAIYMMIPSIDLNQDGEICSRDHIERIENYHNKYLSPTSRLVFSLPETLKKFFVGYTLAVNKFCKQQLSMYLLQDSKKLLTNDDYISLEDYTGKETNNIFKNLLDLVMDKILYLNLDVATENKAQSDQELVYMETPNGEQIKKVQSICQRRFRPIYEKLIIPSISLTNLGYKFNKNDQVVLDNDTNQLLRKWNRIVYVCESLRDVVIVDNPENKGDIITYTKTESRDMEAKYGHKEPETDGREQIVYKPNKIVRESYSSDLLFGDEIIFDSNLDRVVDDFLQQAKKQNNNFDGTNDSKTKNFLRYLFNRNRVQHNTIENTSKPKLDNKLNTNSKQDFSEPLEDFF